METKNKKSKKEAVFLPSILGKTEVVCGNCNLISAILDTLDALIIILDSQGRMAFVNKACEKVSGYTFDELKDKYVWEFLLAPQEIESVKAIFDNLAKGKFPIKHENYWIDKKGEQKLISWSNTDFVADKKVKYIIATGIDITNYKKAEEKIIEHSEELEKINKIMVGRELKMIELKGEIENLKNKLNNSK